MDLLISVVFCRVRWSTPRPCWSVGRICLVYALLVSFQGKLYLKGGNAASHEAYEPMSSLGFGDIRLEHWCVNVKIYHIVEVSQPGELDFYAHARGWVTLHVLSLGTSNFVGLLFVDH